jgi:iron complex outermembrane receptor protein
LNGTANSGGYSCAWNLGYLRKRFGAGGFYGDYPSQETTSTLHGGVDSRIAALGGFMRLRTGGRGHGDDFILVRDNPGAYRNTHYNRSYTAAADYTVSPAEGLVLSVGADTERYGITSPSLGNHGDYRNGVYASAVAGIGKATLSLALRFDRNSRGEDMLSPAAGFSLPVSEHSTLRMRVSRSFRTPTYTERFYLSPANIGDPHIESEHSLSAETGIDTRAGRWSGGVAVFASRSDDAIDWIRYTDTNTPWYSANHGRIDTAGFEARMNISVARSWIIRFNTTLLNRSVERRAGVVSKYVFVAPEQSSAATVTGSLANGFRVSGSIRYDNGSGMDSRSPVTLGISREFGPVNLVLTGRNVFGVRYDEFPGYRAPGRWILFDVSWSLPSGNI